MSEKEQEEIQFNLQLQVLFLKLMKKRKNKESNQLTYKLMQIFFYLTKNQESKENNQDKEMILNKY